MRRIDFRQPETLHGVQATRTMEAAAAAQLPPHALMARAGLAIARLTDALAPHAQTIWVACGPGNNGGDGLVAAAQLLLAGRAHALGRTIWVTLAGEPDALPEDATNALQMALAAGAVVAPQPPPHFDFAIDALLGIGVTRSPEGVIAQHLALLDASEAPVLCVDVPSGLMADSGQLLRRTGAPVVPSGARHTLSLLTLKPGLFTAHGRDAAGDIWFDDLGASSCCQLAPGARLSSFTPNALAQSRRHASHKGTRGEVLVIGGQGIRESGSGMTGAAVLAARSALRMGAGRVYVSLLEPDLGATGWDMFQPELMVRSIEAALRGDLVERSVVVCGCGGGDAVRPYLETLLLRAETLVLDADALNAVAETPSLQELLQKRHSQALITVITPHPLEAARLLGSTTDGVMRDRLFTARTLSERYGVITVLKGSGTVIHAPGEIPLINPTGNGALATAGTGDVLAGIVGAALATQSPSENAFLRTAKAVFEHGHLADEWVKRQGARALCADQLTQQAG